MRATPNTKTGPAAATRVSTKSTTLTLCGRTGPSKEMDQTQGAGQNKQYDSANNLLLMGARPYDPTLGRFHAVDPIDGGSLNNYDYGWQDPLNSYDLSGEIPVNEGSNGGGVISISTTSNAPSAANLGCFFSDCYNAGGAQNVAVGWAAHPHCRSELCKHVVSDARLAGLDLLVGAAAGGGYGCVAGAIAFSVTGPGAFGGCLVVGWAGATIGIGYGACQALEGIVDRETHSGSGVSRNHFEC